jgi:hypothetical protein
MKFLALVESMTYQPETLNAIHIPNMPPAVLPKKEANEIDSTPNNVAT